MTRNRFARRGCRGRGDEITGALTGPGTARAWVERGGGIIRLTMESRSTMFIRMTQDATKWTYGQPRGMGFTVQGRKAYRVKFEMKKDGYRYVEDVVFFTNRPSAAARTISASDAPAKFGHVHFDDKGNPIPNVKG
jgi:hypothetical protein